MTISSLSLTVVRYDNTADMMRARGTARPAPAAEPATTKPSCDDHRSCDSPQRSPLYRALIGAISSLLDRPPASTATPASPTAGAASANPAAGATQAVDTATASTDQAADTAAAPTDAPVDLDEALMNFAHALMQALRGGRESDDGGEREGRGHRHHDHHHHHRRDYGRAAWGDPSQRVAQLGAQMSPAAPAGAATAPVPATSASSAAPSAPAEVDEPAITPAADSVVDPVDTIKPAAADIAPVSPAAVNLNIYVAVPWATPISESKPNLLDAFGTLQQALGLPPADGPSLKEKLSAFLQALAEKLRDGDALTNDMTRAGAMLSVTA